MNKKIICLFLTLSMLSALFPASAFAAEEKEEYKIVAVGDSTCVGVGNDDFGVYQETEYILTERYLDHSSDAKNLGYLYYGSDKAYPALLAEHLSETMPEYEVTFSNLGISGIRANEILSIINGEEETDPIGQSLLNRIYNYIDRWITPAFTPLSSPELFNSEIESADLITLDCVMNSYTYPISGRLFNLMSGDLTALEDIGTLKYSHEDFVNLLGSKSEELIKEPALLLYSALSKLSSGIDIRAGTRLIEDCFCDFCYSFSALVQKLREINPTARIVVCGTYNPFYDMTASISGIKVDIGSMISSYLALSDLYMSELAQERDEYLFVDIPDDIETYREYFAEAGDVRGLSASQLRCLIDSVYSEYPWRLADPLFDLVREKAEAQGLDCSPAFSEYLLDIFVEAERLGVTIEDTTGILSSTVDAAFSDVRANGAEADDLNKIIVDVFEPYFNTIVGCMDLKTIDSLGYLSGIAADLHSTVVSLMNTPKEEMTELEKSTLFCVCMQKIREGMCSHFSEEGCRQKYELVRTALEAEVDTGTAEGKIVDEIRSNAENFVFNTLKLNFTSSMNAVLELIKEIFSSFREIFSFRTS